jgi:phage shock protein PspC (stress-responsive transcriptional regulator)
MKSTIAALLFLAFASSSNPHAADADGLGKPEIRVAKWPNGRIKSQESMLNGVRSGVCKYFDASGKLTEEASYLAEQRNGPTKTYRPDGKLKRYSDYVAGVLNGLTALFNDDGKVIEVESFNDGKMSRRLKCPHPVDFTESETDLILNCAG